MKVLNGITWDHDRGLLPLLETTKNFQKQHPDIVIHWRKRTLQEFGDFPVEELAKNYDLLLIDHPFSGEAYANNILIDYNHYMSQEEMDVRKKQELGKNHRCYCYNGSQLALNVDTAALVSVYQKEVMQKEGHKIPESFDEILELARKTGRVAAPLCATDIWCVFLSLGGAKAGESFITEEGLDSDTACWAIHRLYDLYNRVMPESIFWNPIQIMNEMEKSDRILYAPFCFGYVNYAWQSRKKPLAFGNVPLWPGAKTACVLGGAGIAVSSTSKNIEAAVEYAKYVTLPEVQENEYFLSGGQPGQKNAWISKRNNELSGNFFEDTIDTIEHAYLRPRYPGWNNFQEKCSVLINESVRENVRPEIIAEQIQQFFDICVKAKIKKEK